jgi:5-methyltetrahydrofolate--homocysteine methyltransferase
VHVLDASRAVGVVSALLDPKQKETFAAQTREEQQKLRVLFQHKRSKPSVPLTDARTRRMKISWKPIELPAPSFLGRKVVEDVSIERIAKYIDWTFFFTAWELRGKFPEILEHPQHGQAARELFENGKAMLERIIREGRLRARACYGFWPAASVGDDIVLYTDAARATELTRFSMLRQQLVKPEGEPQLCLADFVAPLESGLLDHVGAFAVTTGLGCEAFARELEAEKDDYGAILVKALADRLAEAFAELMHQQARRDWGYGRHERLTQEDLIAEKYRGIRPALGYPASPDHSEKPKLFELLGATDAGMSLTESFAMLPAASVSGLYLAHPEARYFNVGRVDRDQVQDYAARKGISLAEAERWLAHHLAYEPIS